MKRTPGKLIYACLLCCCILLFAACSGDAESSSIIDDNGPPSSPPGVGQVDTSNEDNLVSSASSAVDSAPSISNSQPQVEQSMTGIIGSMGMGTCYVRMEDGKEIAISMDNVDVSQFVDTFPDCEVVIFYYGEFNGSNTDGITVTRLVSPSQQ